VVGHYDPKAGKDKSKVTLKTEKVDLWIKNGAKPSETVGSLIARARKAEKAAAQK